MDGQQLRQQREYERIALVSGLGNPQADTACLMSLVARLAGEGHTDRPRCASPLIGAFVIPVNDRMPDAARQRLKPFALRVIGTRDGRDAVRAVLLADAMTAEVLPAVAARRLDARRRSPRAGGIARGWSAIQRASLQRQVLRLAQAVREDARPDHGVALAHGAGQLLALGAGLAQDRRDADWHWDLAIGLLDRLCDGGCGADPHPAASCATAPSQA